MSTTLKFHVHSLSTSYGASSVTVSMSEVPADGAPMSGNSLSLNLPAVDAHDFNAGDVYKVVLTKQATTTTTTTTTEPTTEPTP